MKFAKLFTRVKSGLWFIPLLYAVVGLVLNVVTVGFDRAHDYEAVPPEWFGGPDAALAILGTVAASMISLVATVLAITMVVVQLAMAQFSPRIVQTFLQDRPSQNAIGLFVATFVQAILSMREVSVSDDEPIVPGISVAVTFLLVVVSIVVLVIYIHHIGRALRVSALIELVGKNTRKLMDDTYPDERVAPDEAPPDPHVVSAESSGVLSMIGHDDLVKIAQQADGEIALVPALGQFVPAGAPLAELTGVTVDEIDVKKIHKALSLTLERTLDQDVAFGLRMLVDMGIKAISESPHADPTTTVQVIDRVHDVMRQLATRELSDGLWRDDGGTVRLRVPSMTWEAYVVMAFEELRVAGSGSAQVARRLLDCLQDLHRHTPEDRRAPLEEQLRLLKESTEDAFRGSDDDLALAQQPDAQGLGVALDRSR